mgnify:CR=1 FL=1
MCGYLSVYVLRVDDGFTLLGNEVTVRAHSDCSEIVSIFTVSLLFLDGYIAQNRRSLIHKIKLPVNTLDRI